MANSRPHPERMVVATPSNYSTGWGYINNFMRTDESYYREWSGTTTPKFRTKKTRDLPINPHTSHIVKLTHNGFERKRQKIGGTKQENDVWVDGYQMIRRPSGAPSLYDSVPDWNAWWRAHGQCMDEVMDRKFNFAQFVAERKQTVDLITDSALRLGKAARSLRKGDLYGMRKALGYSGGKIKRLSNSVSNDWLAFQYGWKPLLSDIKGAAEHLAQNHLGRPLVLRVSKSAKGVVKGFTVSEQSDRQPGTTWWTQGETQSRFKVYLEYEVTNDFIRQGSQLGITDPLTLAWELMPWSFVVDWFVPVGNFLGRLNFDSGLTFRKGGYTSFNKTTNTCGFYAGNRRKVETDGTYSEDWKNLGLSGASRGDVTYLFRVRYDSSPTPTFPHFKDPFSVDHVLNALALMRGAFGRK